MLSRRQFIALAALVLTATVSNIVGDEEGVPEYTFYDDFDGPAGSLPDPDKWTYDLGGGGWGNNELETYTNSTNNVYQDGNSNLVIAATTDGAGHYWSARIKTQGLFSQMGGHFEGRIKLAPQLGAWLAFWLLGQDIDAQGWPKCGEIDILESFGYNDSIQSSVYTQNVGSTTHGFSSTTPDDGDWHVYRADVDAEGITFFLDGNEYGHCPATYCPPACLGVRATGAQQRGRVFPAEHRHWRKLIREPPASHY